MGLIWINFGRGTKSLICKLLVIIANSVDPDQTAPIDKLLWIRSGSSLFRLVHLANFGTFTVDLLHEPHHRGQSHLYRI